MEHILTRTVLVDSLEIGGEKRGRGEEIGPNKGRRGSRLLFVYFGFFVNLNEFSSNSNKLQVLIIFFTYKSSINKIVFNFELFS